MMQLEHGEFNGYACVWLSNGHVRLAVTTGWGPRVLFFGWQDGPNLFAEVADLVEDTADGRFHFLGGHRLWHAPESLTRTYWPDEWPISLEQSGQAVRFAAPADGAGIAKELRIELAASGAEVRVTHRLRNDGRWAVELAPWALSMLRLGGVALLPQPQQRADSAGLLPNAQLNLWPYTDLRDDRFWLGKQCTLIYARPGLANKLGYRNHHGWLAYWLDGTLFSKHFEPRLDATHPDFNSNAESFIKDRFLELESLGPLTNLEPGAAVEHDEVWRLHADVPAIQTEADALQVASTLGLWH